MAAVLLHAGVVTAVAATDRALARGAEAQQRGHVSCVSSCSWQRGGASLFRTAIGTRNQRAGVVVKASGEGVETEVEIKSTHGDVLPSHEWPENFSLLNFEDLISHYEPALFKAEVCLCVCYFLNLLSRPVLACRSPKRLVATEIEFAALQILMAFLLSPLGRV